MLHGFCPDARAKYDETKMDENFCSVDALVFLRLICHQQIPFTTAASARMARLLIDQLSSSAHGVSSIDQEKRRSRGGSDGLRFWVFCTLFRFPAMLLHMIVMIQPSMPLRPLHSTVLVLVRVVVYTEAA